MKFLSFFCLNRVDERMFQAKLVERAGLSNGRSMWTKKRYRAVLVLWMTGNGQDEGVNVLFGALQVEIAPVGMDNFPCQAQAEAGSGRSIAS